MAKITTSRRQSANVLTDLEMSSAKFWWCNGQYTTPSSEPNRALEISLGTRAFINISLYHVFYHVFYNKNVFYTSFYNTEHPSVSNCTALAAKASSWQYQHTVARQLGPPEERRGRSCRRRIKIVELARGLSERVLRPENVLIQRRKHPRPPPSTLHLVAMFGVLN